MDKREAIQAMLDGKKVTNSDWGDTTCYYIYMLKDGDICDLNFNRRSMLYYPLDGWEIYEEPKPKVKYYRRKWIQYYRHRPISTDAKWYKSMEEFDDAHCGAYAMSNEWEEMEVQVADCQLP